MLNLEKVEQELKTARMGFQFYGLEKVDSTNKFALELAKNGAPQGTVVIADYQTKGRGRLSRKWLSLPGEDLLFSIILKPHIKASSGQKMTLAAATIVHQALTEYCSNMKHDEINFDVKWPNDILANGKKICGILAESILRDKYFETLVLGFGINLNMKPENLENTLGGDFSSLSALKSQPIDRTEFLIRFLQLFDREYLQMENNYFRHVVQKWKSVSGQLGRKIIIHDSDGDKSAEFIDVSSQGYLVYQTADGQKSELIAGDIKWQ